MSLYGEGRTSLQSASPPYERVPNISQYEFNNLLLYTFYINLLDSSVPSTKEIKI